MPQKTSPAQVQKYLKGVDYPASKQQLIQTARREGADPEVLQALQRLPEREFHGPQALSEELGKAR